MRVGQISPGDALQEQKKENEKVITLGAFVLSRTKICCRFQDLAVRVGREIGHVLEHGLV
jgi:hypothetical protein